MLELHLPVQDFASRLLTWYRKNRRRLPWRTDPDPYRVWVAEVMLQQTQVKTVLPYYQKFLDRYPTLENLARAEEAEVLSVWSGLGYYSRARNLHRAAQIVSRQFGGQFPNDYDQALELPGIGPYTAGAILSIAYGRPFPILDGNVRRLFARYLRIEEGLPGSREQELWKFMDQLAKHPAVAHRIGEFNQALMELGALVCTPRNPNCPACPLSLSCRAYKAEMQELLPPRRKQRPLREFHFSVALILKGKRFLLRQNREDTFLRGFWEFPRVEGRPEQQIEEAFHKTHNLKLRIQRWLTPVTHHITHRKLQFHPALARIQGRPPSTDFLWIDLEEERFPVSSYVRKILACLDP